MRYAYKHAGYTLADWTEINPIIVENEIVIEKGIDGAKDRLKRGNGEDHYLDLPYLSGDEFEFEKTVYTPGVKVASSYFEEGVIVFDFSYELEEMLMELLIVNMIYSYNDNIVIYEVPVISVGIVAGNMNYYGLTVDTTGIVPMGAIYLNEICLDYTSEQIYKTLNKITQQSVSELPEKLVAIDEELALKIEKPEHIFQVKYNDIIWDGNWILITLSESISNKDIEDVSFLMSIGNGLVKLNAQIRYPSALTNSGQPIYGFYIRDINNQITRLTAFDYILLKFNIVASTTWKYDGRKLVYGKNVINNHALADSWHSSMISDVFMGCYPTFTGSVIQTRLDLGGVVTKEYQQEYFATKQADMLMFPYVQGALQQDVGSNPNTLEVGSHYNNTNVRHDITDAADKFLFNTIAVGARKDDITSTTGCTSYGYGLEFFEIATRAAVNIDFPLKSVFIAIAEIYIDVTGLIVKATTLAHDANLFSKLEVGDEVYLESIPSTHSFVQSIDLVNGYHEVTLTAPLTEVTALNNYLMYKARPGDLCDDNSSMQSQATAIVTAKLKNIQQETNVSWQLIREAARATAKKTVGGSFLAGQAWDMYRGFGQIQVADAIQYIKDNYTENAEFKADLADKLEYENQKYSLLEFEDLGDLTPVPKKFIQALIDRIQALETN